MARKLLTGLALVIATAATPAALYAANARPVLKLGYDTGGDRIVAVQFLGGGTESIDANEGFNVAFGAVIENALPNIEFELTAGWKYSSINASNGDVTWTRFPLEALAFYRVAQFRLGGGATYHLSPKLEGSGVVGGLNVSVDDALGGILQADFFLTPNMTLGMRYTMLDYKANGVKANSDGVGITFGIRF